MQIGNIGYQHDLTISDCIVGNFPTPHPPVGFLDSLIYLLSWYQAFVPGVKGGRK